MSSRAALPSFDHDAQPEHLSGDERPEFTGAARGLAQVVQQGLQAVRVIGFVFGPALERERNGGRVPHGL